MEDSPPDFIVIRTPHAQRSPARLYDVGLDLVEKIHLVLTSASARFYLKDRLDKHATTVAMRLAHVQNETSSNRWRSYRDVLEVLVDVTTLLDIVERQQATTDLSALTAARGLVQRLIAEIRPLAALGV